MDLPRQSISDNNYITNLTNDINDIITNLNDNPSNTNIVSNDINQLENISINSNTLGDIDNIIDNIMGTLELNRNSQNLSRETTYE